MQISYPVVLVVEDELLIRMHLVDALEIRGYALIEASTAREALEAIQCAERVDVMFTDVDMPGDMDGLTLAHRVAETWPNISIIITSGKGDLGTDRRPARSRFYPKPYVHEAIHSAIIEMLK